MVQRGKGEIWNSNRDQLHFPARRQPSRKSAAREFTSLSVNTLSFSRPRRLMNAKGSWSLSLALTCPCLLLLTRYYALHDQRELPGLGRSIFLSRGTRFPGTPWVNCFCTLWRRAKWSKLWWKLWCAIYSNYLTWFALIEIRVVLRSVETLLRFCNKNGISYYSEWIIF